MLVGRAILKGECTPEVGTLSHIRTHTIQRRTTRFRARPRRLFARGSTRRAPTSPQLDELLDAWPVDRALALPLVPPVDPILRLDPAALTCPVNIVPTLRDDALELVRAPTLEK